MRVLLTGAFGNLGIAAIEELLRQDHDVRCFDIASKKNKKKAKQFNGRIEIIWGDIRNRETVNGAVDGQEAIIHNAAVLPPVTDLQPELARAINVEGTRYVIDAAKVSSLKPLVIYASSVVVHGAGKDSRPPIKASNPLKPTDNYSTHKIECEKIIEESGNPWVALRIGVSLDPNTRDANGDAFRKMFNVTPETRLEYVNPKDVALAQVNALKCPEAVGKAFLIGGGETCQVTYRDLFDAIFNALGIGMPPIDAFGTDSFYTDWMDTEESQRLLKYQQGTFEEYRKELMRSMGIIRWSVFLFRPLVRWMILRYSEPWQSRGKKSKIRNSKHETIIN